MKKLRPIRDITAMCLVLADTKELEHTLWSVNKEYDPLLHLRPIPMQPNTLAYTIVSFLHIVTYPYVS